MIEFLGREYSDKDWKAVCLSIANGIREAAMQVEGRVPYVGILKMRIAADQWERAASLNGDGR